MTKEKFAEITAQFKHNQRVRATIDASPVFHVEGMIRLDENTPTILAIKTGDKRIVRFPHVRVAAIEAMG